MNYIWQILIKAIERDIDPAGIHYAVNHSRGGDCHISPWLEHMPMAGEDVLSHADTNPYFSYEAIFKDILRPGPAENQRDDINRAAVCDLIMHTLADVARVCGMCKRDFYILLIIRDIENGCFGAPPPFSEAEKRALAETILLWYKTADSLQCLRALLTAILTDFYIMVKNNEEIVFYNPHPFNRNSSQSRQTERKLRFVADLFLPIDYPYTIHWRYTYGLIGKDDNMRIGAFVL